MDYRAFQVLKVNVLSVKQVRILKKLFFFLFTITSLLFNVGIKGAIGEPGLPGPSGLPGAPGERGGPGLNGKKTFRSILNTYLLFQDLLVYRVNE